jgi:hypothetical protein
MEGSKSLELHLTEAELETLINAVRRTSDGRFAELEFKLRAAWRRALPRSDLTTLRSPLMLAETNRVALKRLS